MASQEEDFITVAQLMRAHGVKGYIKANPLTHDLGRHSLLKNVTVKKVNGECLELEVEDSRQANTLWLLKFKGYDSPESLITLVNADLMIPESERIPAPEGEYYIDDLEGFDVKLEDGRTIGTVLEVQELPTVYAFNIKFFPEFEKEFSSKPILAPWLDDCVKEVDEDNEAIVCDADYLKGMCPGEK